MKNYSNLEILTEIESRLVANLLTPTELRILSKILATNYSQMAETPIFFDQQEQNLLAFDKDYERLKQPNLLSSLTPAEKAQVKEFLTRHGLKKSD